MIIENDFKIFEYPNFNCIKYNNNFWFTQKTMSAIFRTTPQNITVHLKEIYKFKNKDDGFLIFPVNCIEGTRLIKRHVKHYDLANFYNIAVRSQRFEEFDETLTNISQNNKVDFNFKVSPIKERNFKSILEKSLKDIEKFYCQYQILEYRVDFFFPRLKLIVEFDEDDHKKRLSGDIKRQNEIENKTKYQFIRVREGKELDGLNAILRYREQRFNNLTL